MRVPPASPTSADAGSGPFAAELALVDGLRQATLLLAGAAVQRFGTALEEQQEVLAGLADLTIVLFALESTVIRADQAINEAHDRAAVHGDLARAAVSGRIGAAEMTARWLAASVAEGDDARLLQAGIRRLLRTDPVDLVAASRTVAGHVNRSIGYPL
jgi:hypothetical protein